MCAANVSVKATREAKSADWARLDSNQGPRDYESPALPLSYRPVPLSRIKHSESRVNNTESDRGCSHR